MLEDDLPRLEPLGPGRLDILLIDGVQHGGPGLARDIAHGVEAQGEAGQHIAAGRTVENTWEPAHHAAAEYEQQQARHHEGGHGDTHGTDHPQRAVRGGAPVIGRQTSQRDAHQHRPEEGKRADLGGDGEHLLDDADHRVVLLHLDGDAEIPPEEIAHILEILDAQRLIQAVLLIQGVQHRLRRRLFTHKGVAWDRLHQEKCQRGHEENRKECHQHTLKDILCHFFTSHFSIAYFCIQNQGNSPYTGLIILYYKLLSVKGNTPSN